MCDPQNHPKPGFNTKVVVFFGYVMVLHHVTSLYILDHFEIPHLLVYVFSRLGNFLFFLTGKHTKSYRCFLLTHCFSYCMPKCMIEKTDKPVKTHGSTFYYFLSNQMHVRSSFCLSETRVPKISWLIIIPLVHDDPI